MTEQLEFSSSGEIIGLKEKVEKSIRTLKLAAKMSEEFYHAPLICAYSGGKDSDTILNLCLEAGIDFEAMYSVTTVDAPETLQHVKKVFKSLNERGIKTTMKVARDKDGKPVNMWSLIERKKMPPTRIVRYCCQVLKEQSTPNRMVVTGVRAAESVNRRGRGAFQYKVKAADKRKSWSLEHAEEVYEESHEYGEAWDCQMITLMKKRKDMIVNAIYEWTEQDVWNYIHSRNIEYNRLYDIGFKRVGCVGCPMASFKEKEKEFSLYPHIKENYIKAFDKMMKTMDNDTWKSGEDVFDWWLQKKR